MIVPGNYSESVILSIAKDLHRQGFFAALRMTKTLSMKEISSGTVFLPYCPGNIK
jgi:hypothetical protein